MAKEAELIEFDTVADGDELDDITFDDAPPQVKPTVDAPQVKPTLPDGPCAFKQKRSEFLATSKLKVRKVRKPVAKTPKAQHRVDTVDNNKLANYLDNLVNVEGYQLISVTGSSSIMGAFTVVSVKTV